MASKPKLNPRILDFLHKRLDRPIASIRSDISILKRNYPQATLNAVAQIYAEQHEQSVRRLIGKEDKMTIPPHKIEKVPILKNKKKVNTKEQIKEIIHFATDDHFLKKHVAEVNRAYTKHCYTCVFVLTRKIFENLIIGILKGKYPANRDLYFDTPKARNHDFSVVLDNLFQKRGEFGDDKKLAIERLNQKLKPFKNDANDKAHSLYHIVENAKEVDDWNLDSIMALIKIIQ